jgi:hypothetical protein
MDRLPTERWRAKGQVLEHLAGGQIGDAFTRANRMPARTTTIAALLTSQTRSLDRGCEIEARADSRLVGRQASFLGI